MKADVRRTRRWFRAVATPCSSRASAFGIAAMFAVVLLVASGCTLTLTRNYPDFGPHFGDGGGG
jgi:hypothetical protein